MRRRLMIVAAAVVLIAAAATVLLTLDDGSATPGGAEPAAKAGGTGTVARRTLAERVTLEGTIGYAGESTVLARLSGTVTALPAVGDVVRRGQELYGIGGEPVILMYGKVPAFRTLAEGVDEGPDVEQLESNLAALGYSPGVVDDDFTSTTAEAVEAWQEDLGLESTGEVELGRVAFLPGPQRITQLEATLGEALGGGGGGGGDGSSHLAAYVRPGIGEAMEPKEEREGEQEPPHEEERPKHEPKSGAEGDRSEREPQAEGTPQGEKEPEAEEEAEAEAASTPVLRASSTRRIVSVALEADQQSIAHRGQSVEVVLPGGAQVKGRVRRLTAVEASGEGAPGEESEAGVEATISVTGKHRVPALDGAAVSVLFTQRIRKHVLSVPLTALVAIGGERFAVEVVGAGGARRRIVVTPGLAADGFVEVKGKGLRPGMTVETGG